MDRQDPSSVLAGLFRLSPDAVLGVRRGAVVFVNPAAERLFGSAAAKASVSSLLPGVELTEGAPLTAAVTAAGRGCILTAVPWEDLTVCTLRSAEPAAPIPPAALSRMRTAAANLRLSLDQLTDPEAEDPYTAALYRSYYSLLHVTEQLSDMNALAAGDLTAALKPLELDALAGDLTDSVAILARERGVHLRCRFDCSPCRISGDRDRLEQLLLILLSNSLKNTPPGGTVTVSLRRSGLLFLLTVEDDGPGLTEAELAGVFRPEAENTPAAALSGSGLGLYLAQGIARLHGGALVIRSGQGGCRVSVSFPELTGASFEDADPPVPAGPRRILTELCDVLPGKVFLPRYLD